MGTRSLGLDDRLHDYLMANAVRESEALRRLRLETDTLASAGMRSSAEQAAFLALLARLIGARRILEVGVFTGYATLALAQSLAAEGRIVALDVSEAWTAIGRRHWREAGVAARIELRLEDAVAGLDRLLDEAGADSFDMAYVDADKKGYDAYYERCLKLIRPGGLIAVDNCLWDGKVADPAIDDTDTAAIRALNAKMAAYARIDYSLVPIGDGIGLARRR